MKEKLVKKKNRYLYSSIIRLGLAIGDWTKLKLIDDSDQEISVSNVSQVAFDGLSKPNLVKLHHLHYIFADLLTKQLSKDLKIKIDLHTILVNQVTYDNFTQSITDDVLQYNLEFSNIGTVNMLLGGNFVSLLIDRLFGGSGDDSTRKSVSEIEKQVVGEQLSQLIPHFLNVWDNVIEAPEVKSDLNMGFVPDKMVSSRESFVVFTFYLYFGSNNLSRIILSYPSRVLKHFDQLKSKSMSSFVPNVSLNDKTLDKIRFKLKATLGKSSLKMSELNTLEVGDIIPLDSEIKSPVKLTISDKVKIDVQPCVKKGRLGCQILSKDAIEGAKVVMQSPKSKVENNQVNASSDDDDDVEIQSEPKYDRVLKKAGSDSNNKQPTVGVDSSEFNQFIPEKDLPNKDLDFDPLSDGDISEEPAHSQDLMDTETDSSQQADEDVDLDELDVAQDEPDSDQLELDTNTEEMIETDSSGEVILDENDDVDDLFDAKESDTKNVDEDLLLDDVDDDDDDMVELGDFSEADTEGDLADAGDDLAGELLDDVDSTDDLLDDDDDDDLDLDDDIDWDDLEDDTI
ncbi:hypothetical protein DID76_03210 [Candidatus Marinamargulisbacteria bacterium SCGC AG-414-C22]|nr:hypothetical protein DID76_03210 [Candidatus Marinamargulisbacteria bacterium SCGC AG-414-C22]